MENTDCIKKIYLVGGAIRDKLLGLPLQDKDYVAIGYTQDDFSHLKKVGKNFPVFLLSDSSQIALARRESKVSQGYNGFSYDTKNVSLIEDLKRRDLTINAMAFDEEEKRMIDPFDGQKDLKNKILRHISNTFVEDPLRVLRVARFRAKLGSKWQIAKDTKALIYSMKEDLKFLEKNRIYKEMIEVFRLERSDLFFSTLLELNVLGFIFPLIDSLNFRIYRKKNAFFYAMEMLKNAKNLGEILKFSILYLNFLEDSKSFESELDIQMPKKIQKNISLLIYNHHKILRDSKDILEFLEVYLKEESLFLLQEQLYLLDKNGKKDFKLLKKILLKVKKVSPKEWIENQKIPPNGRDIQAYIYKERLREIELLLI